jgi:plasmid stabilization system protein ParE
LTQYRIVTDPSADRDVEAAATWYEYERSGLGLEFLDEVRSAYDRVVNSPFGYQVLRFGVRRALVRRFPYIVYFIIEDNVVEVIAVLHTSRNPAEWQRRREL